MRYVNNMVIMNILAKSIFYTTSSQLVLNVNKLFKVTLITMSYKTKISNCYESALHMLLCIGVT